MVPEELEPADGDERVVEAREQPDGLVVDAEVERERGEAVLADPAEHDEHDAPAHDHGAEHPAHRIAPPEWRLGPDARFVGHVSSAIVLVRGRGSRSRLRSCQGTRPASGVSGAECREGAATTGSLHGTLQQDPARRRRPQAQVAGVDRARRRRASSPRCRRAPTTSCARSTEPRGARSSTSIGDADKQQEHLDDLLPEAFAAVREAGDAHARPASLRRPDHGRRRAALRLGRGDEDRRGQDPRRHAARLPQRARRRRRAPRHRQRLPGQARRRVDGPDLPVPRARGRRGPPRDRRLRARSGARTRPTSPTAPTTSSASTTCATTWPCVARATRCSAATTSPSSTRSTRSSSTRPARRSSSPAAPTTRRSSTSSSRRIVKALEARPRLRGRRGEAHRRPHRGRCHRGGEGARRRQPLRERQPELRPPAPGRAARPRSCSSATSTTSCRAAR